LLRGISYLELCLATVILSLCLVPASKLVPTLLSGQRDLDTSFQLSLIAQEKLEKSILQLDTSFYSFTQMGDLAASGHPGWRYYLHVVVDSSQRFATIRSEAYVDEDGNGTRGSDELHVCYDAIQANRGWSP
jgi:hypothetical protein